MVIIILIIIHHSGSTIVGLTIRSIDDSINSIPATISNIAITNVATYSALP